MYCSHGCNKNRTHPKDSIRSNARIAVSKFGAISDSRNESISGSIGSVHVVSFRFDIVGAP